MFDALNHLIQQVAENGQSKLLFTIIQLLNVPICFVYVLWFSHKMKLGLKKMSVLCAVAFLVIYVWMLILHWAFTGFNNFGGQNMVMVFVWVPIIALFLSKLFKITWTEECYIHAACLPLMHGVGHIACLFEGCCHGYESTWGVYNPSLGSITFPVQMIETIVSISIAVFLCIRAHKQNYVADEKQFPLMLTMYGSARFVLEFLRDNNKIILGCSDLSLHALFMLVVGIIWLVKINKKAAKAAEPSIPTMKKRVRR